MNLGGSRLVLRGWLGASTDTDPFCLWLSDDSGQTWSDPEEIPPLSDGQKVYTDVAPNFLIEGETIRFMF